MGHVRTARENSQRLASASSYPQEHKQASMGEQAMGGLGQGGEGIGEFWGREGEDGR